MCANRFLILAIVVIVTMTTSTPAAPPIGSGRSPQPRNAANYDTDTYINANRILGFITNDGSLFSDLGALFGRTNGLYYPYESIPAILSGQQDKTVIYAAGLWMGGKVDGHVRVTVSEYSEEYVPGPMLGGTYRPDIPAYHVYKLHSDSGASNPNNDYSEWPVDQGAPVDQLGDPLMSGDQMLWSVFNDADTGAHTNNTGSTLPLGVEVRMTTWATNSVSTTEGDAVYVKYLLYNKGGIRIDSFYISFWADPDLGSASDDLVGCDTLNNIFYCYNATNNDGVYGSEPPAFGGHIISGLVVPSPGNTATFDGHVLSDHRNLGMTAFSRIINGTDAQSPFHAFNFMKGKTGDGLPWPNGTGFAVPGDPVTSTGDVDVDPADRRFMASCGPITFMPGDSQQIVFKFVTQLGGDRLNAISRMKAALLGSLPVSSTCDSATTEIFDHGALLDVYLDPAGSPWLRGYDWGRLFFNGGVTLGQNFLGSYLRLENFPDSFPSVEVRFSKTTTQKAYRYLYPGYNYAGYYDVPFTVWDVDHNRQLNAAFVEIPNSPTCDSTWGPGDSAALGGREYLIIFHSNYSGENPAAAPLPYETLNLKGDGDALDVLYGGWFCVAPSHSLNELNEPQKLIFLAQSRNPNGKTTAVELPTTKRGQHSYQPFLLNAYSTGFGLVRLQTVGDSAITVEPYNIRSELPAQINVVTIREVANGTGPVEPPNGRDVLNSFNSTDEWKISYSDVSTFNLYGNLQPHDYEIRFTDTSLCYDRLSAPFGVFVVPFQLWDIGTTPNDPSDDTRLLCSMTDWDYSGDFSYGDRIYAIDRPYETPLPNDYYFGSESLTRIILEIGPSYTGALPAPGTKVRITTSRNFPVPPMVVDDPPSTAEPINPVWVRYQAAGINRDLSIPYAVRFSPSVEGNVSAATFVRDSATNGLLTTLDISALGAGSCCTGPTGNVDCDGAPFPDISDLTALIDYMFVSLSPLCCEAEANCDNIGGVDIADLTALILYLFINFDPLPTCP